MGDTPHAKHWAHAPGSASNAAPHDLDAHLKAVGDGAAAFSIPALQQLARLAGIWHDLGKRRPGFQRYIRQAGGVDAHIEGRVPDRDKTHSAAGALWAEQHLARALGPQGRLASRLLQYVIAGHHAGLANGEDLAARLASGDAAHERDEAIRASSPSSPLLEAVVTPELLRGLIPAFDQRSPSGTPGRTALWTRMLFSALVDADFLDTEAYFDGTRAAARGPWPSIDAMRQTCDAHLHAKTAGATGPINAARSAVLEQCRRAAEHAPGVFRLTVPTGGGKTLSSLAFALAHAQRHGLRRVVYAIPYTSIIEQTADVFREVFAALGEEVLIEHHSAVDVDPAHENHRSRLATENWDAPLVVTTNVQLFESLFARRTSRCRKLHRLAGSVIVLDEAQMLPTDFLQPIVDVLRLLVQDFGATLLLCTATQPVLDGAQRSFDPQRGLRRGLGTVREIVEDVPALFDTFKRVDVVLPADLQLPTTWPELAARIAREPAVLAIVNRRADAAELTALVEAASGEPCAHLSALMCAQHRSDVLAQIKHALKQRAAGASGELAPIRVVSTQLIEAGVDVDFPVVFRAMAGIDSIAQAAGRCNREGKLSARGRVHVFVPPTKSPPGFLRLARATAESVLSMTAGLDPLSPPVVTRYFERLLHDAATIDRHDICGHLKGDVDAATQSVSIRFADAADAFRLIDHADAATVIVRYRGLDGTHEQIDGWIAQLFTAGPQRWLMRKLQRYGVSIYRRDAERLEAEGRIEMVPLCPGLYVERRAASAEEPLYHLRFGLRLLQSPGEPILVA